jgi:hypothetical protein
VLGPKQHRLNHVPLRSRRACFLMKDTSLFDCGT